MKALKTILFFLLFYNTSFLFAQKTETIIQFNPLYDGHDLSLNKQYYKLNEHDSIRFETLKFYISGIELWGSMERVWKEPYSFHLVDVSDSNSLKIILKPQRDLPFTEIRFNLGIDSITNVSGALGRALDPSQGMYWTWQSGYINFKLEGNSNLCQTRKNEFQFHLGGYLRPFNTLQNMAFLVMDRNHLDINIDLKQLLTKVDLSQSNQIMSPGKEAAELSKILGSIFTIPK